MYFCDVAMRAAGSGANGRGLLGDLGGVAECCGLSERVSTIYLPLVDREGSC